MQLLFVMSSDKYRIANIKHTRGADRFNPWCIARLDYLVLINSLRCY